MALKRINKELTDLGRYAETSSNGLGLNTKPAMCMSEIANEKIAVILPLHAQQDLLVMTWYVVPTIYLDRCMVLICDT